MKDDDKFDSCIYGAPRQADESYYEKFKASADWVKSEPVKYTYVCVGVGGGGISRGVINRDGNVIYIKF